MSTKFEVEKYKDYPDDSPYKALYDIYHLPFDAYLEKYYQNPDLNRWDYINSKFVNPLFDGTSWEDYRCFLNKAKPNFLPIEIKVKEFWKIVKDDDRFSDELKQFFAFLYSINFYRELSFEEWIKIDYWRHPWYKDPNEENKTILELITYKYSENYLKAQLATLSIF